MRRRPPRWLLERRSAALGAVHRPDVRESNDWLVTESATGINCYWLFAGSAEMEIIVNAIGDSQNTRSRLSLLDIYRVRDRDKLLLDVRKILGPPYYGFDYRSR